MTELEAKARVTVVPTEDAASLLAVERELSAQLQKRNADLTKKNEELGLLVTSMKVDLKVGGSQGDEHQLSKVQAELTKAQARIRTLEQDNDKHMTELSGKIEELSKLRAEHKEQQSKKSPATTTTTTSSSSKSSPALTKANQRVTELEREVTGLKSSKERVTQLERELKDANTSHHSALQSLAQELKETKAELAKVKQANTSLEAKLAAAATAAPSNPRDLPTSAAASNPRDPGATANPRESVRSFKHGVARLSADNHPYLFRP